MELSKKWQKNDFSTFKNESNMVSAYELRSSDIVLMSNSDFFYIYDTEEQYANEEVAKLYDDVTEAIPEHITYSICGGKSFMDEDSIITDIPYNAKFHIWRMYDKSELK